ncbi:MAG: SpoIIE family protein phosphatase [Candidatus Krumholzibacteria bacterium]|nr:SpoIIE family protein phosphatase [Candidatus Krumholzibacteria bacterium]
MHKKFYRALERLLHNIDTSTGDERMLSSVVKLLVSPENAQLFGIASGRVYRERALDFVLIESVGEYGEAIEGKTVQKDYALVRHLLEHRLWLFRPDSPGYDAALEAQFSHMNNAAIAVGQNPIYIVSFGVENEDRGDLLVMLEAIRAAIGLKLRQSTLEGQMRQAQAIQASLLPRQLPKLAGFDLAARTVPADEVGGDVYDVQPLEPRMLGILIADASGHGLPAALQARDVIVGMRMGQSHNEKITALVERLNRVVHQTILVSRFITLFYAELEDTGNVTYVNAGHNPPLLIARDGEVFQLQTSGPVLGPLPDAVYRRCYMTLRPGELLVLFTDGVIERTAPDAADDDEHEAREFGLEHLVPICLANRHRDAAAVVEAVIAAVRDFGGGLPLQDDVSVLAIKREEVTGDHLAESLTPISLSLNDLHTGGGRRGSSGA